MKQTRADFTSMMDAIWGGIIAPGPHGGVIVTGHPDYETCHDAVKMARAGGARKLYSAKFGSESGYVYEFADGKMLIGTNGAWFRPIRTRRS